VTKAVVASTRGGAEKICEQLRSKIECVLHFSSQTEVPIEIEYSSRQTLGTDRIAVAVGVVCEMGIENALVVDMGSAITYDIVENGIFKGGNISLGVAMRFRALHEFTSLLPLCQSVAPNDGFGKSTKEAIEQGVMQGITHEIEGYISAFSQEKSKICTIFTGGDAKYFVKRIKNAIFADCEPVICGLNTILEYNAKRR
jgi:type III pantothenate kinase